MWQGVPVSRAGMLQAEQGPLSTGDGMFMAAARSHV